MGTLGLGTAFLLWSEKRLYRSARNILRVDQVVVVPFFNIARQRTRTVVGTFCILLQAAAAASMCSTGRATVYGPTVIIEEGTGALCYLMGTMQLSTSCFQILMGASQDRPSSPIVFLQNHGSSELHAEQHQRIVSE